MKREQEIQREILDWLQAHGILAWRCNLGGVRVGKGARARNPMRGFPDIAGILRHSFGRFFAVEVKRPGKHLEPHQLEWKRKLESAGVLHLVAHSAQDVARGLDPDWKPEAFVWPGESA